MATERFGKAVLELGTTGDSAVFTSLSKIDQALAATTRGTAAHAKAMEQMLRAVDQQFGKAVTGADGLTAAVTRFSGVAVVSQANAYASAIESIGGASQLTAGEQRQVNTVVTEALAKYKALGQEAPKSLHDLAEATKQVEAPTAAAGISVGKLVAAYVTAEAILGTVKTAFRAYVDLIGSSIQSYAAAEAAQAKLTGALRAQGEATPETIAQYGDLADQFQRTTVFADDLLMEMQALLVQVGNVMPNEMEGALKAATDLASGLGIDLRTATMLVGKAFEGETGTLKRYGIVIDETKLKAEGMPAVLDAIQRRFGGQAQAEVDTYSGQIKQLDNAWDNLKEKLGQMAVTAPEVQSVMKILNMVLQDMTRESGAAVTLVGKLWEGWQKWIAFGQTVTPGVGLFHRALARLAEEADRQALAVDSAKESLDRYKQSIDKMALKPLSLDMRAYNEAMKDLTSSAAKLIEQRLEEAHRKAGEAAKQSKREHDQLFGLDLIAKADGYIKTLGDIGKASLLTTEKKRELHEAVEQAIAVYQALGREAPAALRDILKLTTELIPATRSFSATASGMWVPFMEGAEDAGQALQNIAAGLEANGNLLSRSLNEAGLATKAADDAFREWSATHGVLLTNLRDTREGIDGASDATVEWTDNLSGLAQSLAQLAQVSGGTFGGIVQWLSTVVAAMDVADKAGKSMKQGWEQLAGENKNVVAGLVNLAQGAIAAGAALLQATAHGNTFQRTLGGIAAGAQAGAAFGPWGTAIGAVVGGLTGLFRGLFGVSEAVQKARADLDTYVDSLRETATEQQRVEAGGHGWALMLIRARDAMLALGRSAKEAEDLVARALNTDNPEDSARAIAELNELLKEQGRILEANKAKANTLFDDIMSAASEWGGIPDFLRAEIEQLIALGLLTDEQAEKLRGLGDSGALNIKKMEEASALFHGRLESLGPAFQQAKIDETAGKYINAFEAMMKGGADVGGILFDAREEFSALVSEAIKGGKTLPANMKPWIEELQRAGLLVDENGEKITDLSGLRYGEAMETEGEKATRIFEEILEAIRDLVGEIRGPLLGAIDDIPRDIKIKAGVEWEGGEPPVFDRDNPDRNRPFGSSSPFSAGLAAPSFASGAAVLANSLRMPSVATFGASRVLEPVAQSSTSTHETVWILAAIHKEPGMDDEALLSKLTAQFPQRVAISGRVRADLKKVLA